MSADERDITVTWEMFEAGTAALKRNEQAADPRIAYDVFSAMWQAHVLPISCGVSSKPGTA